MKRLLDEAHRADAEQDVLQEAGRARVRVSGGQQDVLEGVRVAEFGRQTSYCLKIKKWVPRQIFKLGYSRPLFLYCRLFIRYS